MNLNSLIGLAKKRGASDIHIEPGLPLAFRVRGELLIQGEPLSAELVHSLVREVVEDKNWKQFRKRGSWDSSRNIANSRCRINALTSMRGVGLAIRLLPESVPTLQSLNLHPELVELVHKPHGLVIVSGPTGSGKSSTLAALINEINCSKACHIVTIEQPIEYNLVPVKSYVRQREVERDTPSFAQALIDSMREDPDVLMVGEMREADTMRLTLNAAETGHLVLTTMHSSNVVDALSRIVQAFGNDIQSSIASMLADSLVAVICQRLVYRPDLDLRVPECEVLTGSSGVRGVVRSGDMYKLPSLLETGAADGMWSRERYRSWLSRVNCFQKPTVLPDAGQAITRKSSNDEQLLHTPATAKQIREQTEQAHQEKSEKVMVIDEPNVDVNEIVSQLEQRYKK